MAKAPVTVANAFVLLRTGGCRESTASATTGSVTNMTALSAQGMDCATVAAVSAGTAGLGTPVRSGWEQSTEQRTEEHCCPERPVTVAAEKRLETDEM